MVASVNSIFKQSGMAFANWSTARKVCSFLIFFSVWAIVAFFAPYFKQLPPPNSVILALFDLPVYTVLLEIGRSLYRVLAGFFIGLLLGFPIGVLCGYTRIFNYLLFPAIETIRPIPPLAWIPLAVLFFVTREAQIIFLTFYGAFFPIVYNTMGGISQVDIRLPRAAMSFGIGRWAMLKKVVVPAALPQIFTGLKVAMGITWLMVVAAEMIANAGGLGYWVWHNHVVMNYPMVILGMGIIGLLGALCSQAIESIGNRIMVWRKEF